MYVGTFSLQHGTMLVRVDVETNGLTSTASYTVTYRSGEVETCSTPLAPDENGVGPAVTAVVTLIRDLVFANVVDGSVELLQSTPDFTQTELDAILEGAAASAYVVSLGTSSAIQ
jgi:hypothetical protein